MDAKLKVNPHRKGSVYWDMFQYMRQKQVFTRQEMIEKNIGSYYDVTIMLSPRKTSKRGNPLGNPAAHGHLYYVEPLPKTIRGEYKRFHFHWRSIKMERRSRPPIVIQKKVMRKVAVEARKVTEGVE